MAKQYRQTIYRQGIDLGNTGSQIKIFDITPIDAEQAMPAYVDKVKISWNLASATDAQGVPLPPVNLLFHASTDDGGGLGDAITAQATGIGGGTVWLSLKRRIRSSAEEVNRGDGPVYLFAETPTIGKTVTVNLVAEAWGRFIDLD